MCDPILIADDDPVLAELVRFKLRQAGFDVVTVSDGQQALNHALTTKFGLIISDHQMPELTGVELCRRLRAEGPNTETPVFFCTGKSFEIDHEFLHNDLGVKRVLSKPFSPRELVALATEELAESTS